MKLRTLAIAALTVTGLTVGIASPAAADDTATTFELTGGTLTFTVAANAALTNGTSAEGTQTISGTLGTVLVTDDRGGTANWAATATSSAFTGTGLSTSTGVNYTGGVVSTTGTITAPDGTVQALNDTTPVSVVAPTSLSGNNTASWNPSFEVLMPAGALAGSYSGVVTTSVT